MHVLNKEQINVMNLAMDGHNVFVGGKPGTGKTYIVKRVVSVLQQTKQVKVTCTTGMACSLYDDAMTLHSFGGIQNSRMNVDSIVSSIMSRDTCKRRWLETDVLCIDEVSQLNAKNFELMNTLAQRVRGSTKLLGGLQVICIGDFFQLPPIENDVDKGRYCFESILWQHVFNHSVVLETVYRQDPKENISSKLTNGTRGRVIQLEEDGPTVNFYNVGITCKLTRVSWFACESGSSCDVIGQRNQYPLKLAWGITVHKSQGQTLQAAYVHSGREFVAGQLYVAASRVSSPEGLSILQFNPARLIKANNRVVDFYKKVSLSEPLLDHQCCRNKIVDIQPTVVDFQFIDDPLFDEPLSSSDLAEIDAFCQTYFVSSVDSECEAGQVDEGVEVDEGGSSSCHKETHPDLMDNDRIHSFLEELKDTSTQASVSGSLAFKINNLIASLQQSESLPKVKTFIEIQWTRLSKEVNKNIKNKKDGSTSYDFKSIMATEFSILNMEQLDSEFSAVTGSKNFNLEHHCLKTELVKAVRVAIISKAYLERCVEDGKETEVINVWNMSEEGKGKVRYVGGWTLIKLIYGYKRYITQNVASNNSKVRQEMNQRYLYVTVLESLLVQSSNIHECTEYEGTLSVTDTKQYRKNSLVHISDKAFQLFMYLEELRVKTLCHHNLNILQQKFLPVAIAGVKNDKRLQELWFEILDKVKGTRGQKLVILGSIVDKFFKMGAGQYIRDFRRDHHIMKTEAHRKRVQERKLVKERIADKVTLDAIKQDTSHKKQDSHNLLVALVTKRPDIFNTSAYTKKELKILFEAYGERFVTKWKKEKMNDTLVLKIKSEGQMKNPNVFDNS